MLKTLSGEAYAKLVPQLDGCTTAYHGAVTAIQNGELVCYTSDKYEGIVLVRRNKELPRAYEFFNYYGDFIPIMKQYIAELEDGETLFCHIYPGLNSFLTKAACTIMNLGFTRREDVDSPIPGDILMYYSASSAGLCNIFDDEVYNTLHAMGIDMSYDRVHEALRRQLPDIAAMLWARENL